MRVEVGLVGVVAVVAAAAAGNVVAVGHTPLAVVVDSSLLVHYNPRIDYILLVLLVPLVPLVHQALHKDILLDCRRVHQADHRSIRTEVVGRTDSLQTVLLGHLQAVAAAAAGAGPLGQTADLGSTTLLLDSNLLGQTLRFDF